MSLLLDALKKAAEQKAEKSRQEAPEFGDSDETVIGAAAEDISGLEAAERDLRLRQRERDDETLLDSTELQTQYDNTRLNRNADDHTEIDSTEVPTGFENTQFEADQTSLEIPDTTDTSVQAASAQMRTGEDETIVFAAEDDTDVSRTVQSGEQTDFTAEIRAADATDTRIEQTPEDQTDISNPVTRVDQIESASTVQSAPGEDSDPGRANVAQQAGDEDMSLLLVDRDPTNLTAMPTSLTDPQAPQDQMRALLEDDDFALVDTTRHQLSDDAATATQTNVTSVTGIAQDTQTTRGATTRLESTSTRTYAPDNYDRTLMKLPSDDASKIFAGMKAESDVVMTPDYAKKVFRSKSSAQRVQHYKIYAGIAIVIMLAVIIFGAFEYQQESDSIDTSLRSLKRDPMPGVIKPGGQKIDLFAESKTEVDTRTIEIIENANAAANDGVVATEEVVTDEVINNEAAVEVVTSEPEVVKTAKLEPAPTAANKAQITVKQIQSATEATASMPSDAPLVETRTSTSNLQITSTSQVQAKDVWLQEAYAAYLAGDDELALTLYNKVLKVDPGNRNALLARAAINIHNGDFSAAIDDYQALLIANPKDSLAMTSFLSIARYSPRDAESQLKLMLREDPDSPYLNFALANTYGTQNRWQEAQGYYFRALQNNPNDPNYAYNLAVSLEHIEQPRTAISYYQRALDNFEKGLATFNRNLVEQRMELLANK